MTRRLFPIIALLAAGCSVPFVGTHAVTAQTIRPAPRETFAAATATQPIDRADSKIWPDRRPLMSLSFAAVEYVTAENPHGWLPHFMAPMKPGRVQAAPSPAKIRDYVRDIIRIGKANGVQGFILWNGEGASRYAAVGFEGEPRNIPDWVRTTIIAPVRAAGFGVGCTIRHTVILKDDGGAFCLAEPWNAPAVLIRKVDDAKAAGCGDYLYIDSNCDFLFTKVLDFRAFYWLHEQRPDVLLIPEHETPDGQYRGFSMPYRDTREGPRKGPAGGEVVCLFFGDEYPAKVTPEQKQQLREDVAAGSILVMRGGWESPELPLARELK